MKEGKKTTEFYLSIFGAVMGVVVSMGYLTPEQSGALVSGATQIGGSLVSAASVLGYGVSRGLAKKNTN